MDENRGTRTDETSRPRDGVRRCMGYVAAAVVVVVSVAVAVVVVPDAAAAAAVVVVNPDEQLRKRSHLITIK